MIKYLKRKGMLRQSYTWKHFILGISKPNGDDII